MAKVVYRHAADVHADFSRLQRDEPLLCPGEGIVNFQHTVPAKWIVCPAGRAAKLTTPAKARSSANSGLIRSIIEIVARTMFLVESIIIYNNLARLFNAKYSI